MPDYPPTLDIPVSASFRDLDDVKIELLFDEPTSFTDKWENEKYRYGVKHNGVEKTLFATKTLHEKIQATNPTKGTIVSIARVGEGKDTRWDVVYDSGPTGTGVQKAAKGAANIPAGNPNPAGFQRDLDLYWTAMELAMDRLPTVAPDHPVTVDLNAVAFVIYKMAKDHNIDDPANPKVPERTEDAEDQAKNKMRTELEKIFKATGLDSDAFIEVLNSHAGEGQQIDTWDDVDRQTGIAAYATAQNVQSGLQTWDQFRFPDKDEDGAPF